MEASGTEAGTELGVTLALCADVTLLDTQIYFIKPGVDDSLNISSIIFVFVLFWLYYVIGLT